MNLFTGYDPRLSEEYYPMGAAQEFLACVTTATGHLVSRRNLPDRRWPRMGRMVKFVAYVNRI